MLSYQLFRRTSLRSTVGIELSYTSFLLMKSA
nr:MAG TPA: hypothetical protein [Caudoviricetes sp.]